MHNALIYIFRGTNMSNFTIPIILVFTVVVAGVFAFAPIENASTVHTQIFANSAHISEDSASVVAGAAGEDITVTCPTNSNGCHILDIYIRENDGIGNSMNLDTANAVIDDVVYEIALDLNIDLNEGAQAVPTVSGVAIGAGDTLTIAVSGTSTTYSVHVIASVEGNTEIDVTLG